MTDLANLTTRLQSVLRIRSLAAWTRSLAAVVGVALWSLIAAFAVDVMLHMRLVERGCVLVIWVGFMAWACWRFMRVLLRRRDSLIDVALMTEQQQGIASDLVAALQFGDPRRPQFGLEALRTAVIADTAELADGLDVNCGYSWSDFRRRTWIVVGAATVVVILCLACGGHVRAFANRFVLGNASYPTRTRLLVTSPGDSVGYGQPVRFVVEGSGELPGEGTVHVVGDKNAERTVVRLKPTPEDPAKYVGQLPRAIAGFSFSVELGDARSQKYSVRVLPLPKVNVELEITTPEYAANKLQDPDRRHSALAGSRVVPVVTADKTLRSATIELNGKPFEMIRRGSAFVLDASWDPALKPLLGQLSEPLRYQVQVEDVDGLKLERPAGGVLRMIPDRAPTVTFTSFSKQILSKASPTVRVVASDDFGIHSVAVSGSVIRRSETGRETDETEDAVTLAGLDDVRGPSVDRAVKIDLSKLDLAVGDRLVCVAEVTDYRGRPGESASSPSVIFEIVDRATVMERLREISAEVDGGLSGIISVHGDIEAKDDPGEQ